ncbi:MAG: MFS transporter [Actinomycetota bacterium]|nr:MFS transporter [Actinomycetota bacterium]
MRVRDSIGALGALGDPRFAWYFAARSVSTVGSSMAPVALAFAVLHLTGSATALAQVVAVRTVAMVVFLLVGGVVSDRLSRTAVMQVSHALTALTQGAAAALVISGEAQLGALIAIEAVNGAVSAFTMPAMMGVVPLVVDRSRLQQANALLSFSRSGIAVIGPSVAGILVVSVGPGWALAVDSLSYVFAILCLLRVHVPGRVRTGAGEAPSLVTELREGWGEFTSRTWLWLVVVVFGVLNAIHAGAIAVLGPVVATTTASLGVGGWALSLSAEAAGTVAMTLTMLRLSFRFPLRAGMLGVSAIGIPVLVLGLAPATVPLVVAMVVAGAGVEVFGVGWATALHEHVPEAVLSRVSSYDALGSIVAVPVGTLVFGALAAAFDPGPVLVVGGIIYAGLALGTLLSRSVRTLEHAVADGGRPAT